MLVSHCVTRLLRCAKRAQVRGGRISVSSLVDSAAPSGRPRQRGILRPVVEPRDTTTSARRRPVESRRRRLCPLFPPLQGAWRSTDVPDPGTRSLYQLCAADQPDVRSESRTPSTAGAGTRQGRGSYRPGYPPGSIPRDRSDSPGGSPAPRERHARVGRHDVGAAPTDP
jgi:hypothetical protein